MLDDRDHRPDPNEELALLLDRMQPRRARPAPCAELLLLLGAGLLALGYLFAAMTDAGLRALAAAAQVLS